MLQKLTPPLVHEALFIHKSFTLGVRHIISSAGRLMVNHFSVGCQNAGQTGLMKTKTKINIIKGYGNRLIQATDLEIVVFSDQHACSRYSHQPMV